VTEAVGATIEMS